MIIKYSLLAAALAVLVLTACEGKKSLDGYPMDKPPPSAYAPRDSEPVFEEPAIDDADTTTNEENNSGNDDEEATESEKVSAVTEDATDNEEEAGDTDKE